MQSKIYEWCNNIWSIYVTLDWWKWMWQEKQLKKASLQYERYDTQRSQIAGLRKTIFCYPSDVHGGNSWCLLIWGNVNGERFQEFTTNSLLPILHPFNWSNSHSVVIMDNASIHHVHGVIDLIESQGARLIFLPSYSPNLNPMEEVFSKVKSIMKENHSIFQSCTETRVLLTMEFNMVTKEDCISYISHSGYQQ